MSTVFRSGLEGPAGSRPALTTMPSMPKYVQTPPRMKSAAVAMPEIVEMLIARRCRSPSVRSTR